VVVAEFFDIGQSRSLPWKRRPESATLLEAFKAPDRGFDAVVIGEPARAFYGNQFGLTFPVFVHYGIELWVPEIGGKVDPGSDAHDLVMSLYGGMSKGERNRIKVRVRSAMAAQAKHDGRFLGGRPPYGYRLADAGAHPNPGKAVDGKRLHQLEVDRSAPPIVRRIFAEYIAGRGYFAIAQDLTRDGIPSPSAHDPARNRHRDMRSWSKIAVRSILMNPRYTGRQVWNRQRRDEILVDVEDVAQGHLSRMKSNDRSDWVWSTEQTHEPIIDSETFAAAQSQMAAGSYRPTTGKTRTTKRTYVLSGRVHCGLCGHRMQGNLNHDANHYRCKFATDRAPVPGLDHPKNVYVRESAIVPKLDEWIVGLFDPANLAETCAALTASGGENDVDQARIEAAQRKLADCDRRLAKYRAALDAENGADPAIVAGWMSEVQGERLRVEREIALAQPQGRYTKAQIREGSSSPAWVSSQPPWPRPIRSSRRRYTRSSESASRYDPTRHVARIESRPAAPWATVSVGGAYSTLSTRRPWAFEWAA